MPIKYYTLKKSKELSEQDVLDIVLNYRKNNPSGTLKKYFNHSIGYYIYGVDNQLGKYDYRFDDLYKAKYIQDDPELTSMLCKTLFNMMITSEVMVEQGDGLFYGLYIASGIDPNERVYYPESATEIEAVGVTYLEAVYNFYLKLKNKYK
jgi:hypothetical protein